MIKELIALVMIVTSGNELPKQMDCPDGQETMCIMNSCTVTAMYCPDILTIGKDGQVKEITKSCTNSESCSWTCVCGEKSDEK